MADKVFYRGKAFVVGNDHYDQVKPDLDNAVNDAKDIYEAFRDLGFMMMPEAYDIGFEKFDELFESFKSDLHNYEVGVLYFSGHGIEINGKNYLVMKDTPIGDLPKSTIRLSIDLQDCIKELHDTKCKAIIVIIDACRNNPFEGKDRGWGSVNLAPIFAPKGTLIAYSTSPGETASDYGMEGHSVYTGALLKHLKEEGLEIETFFKKVRATVDTMTRGKKTSWEHTSLIGSFAFNSGKMTHIGQIGYDDSVVRDSTYKNQDKAIASIITQLKSYNYYTQNDGVDEFRQKAPRSLDKNQLFIIGRNLLQSAVGGAHHAQQLIEDGAALAKYTIDGENHLLNGILFEIYFNKEGRFRYKNFKTSMLNQLMRLVSYDSLACSFKFINDVLKEFAPYLIFIPSVKPAKVAINVLLKKEEVEYWNQKMEMPVIKSITFEGQELIAEEEESNVFPFYSEEEVKKDALQTLMCDGYGIPSEYVEVIYNEDPGKQYMWFNKKFKRNYKGGDEEGDDRCRR